ncbi:MAG: fibronectin type III domain-containing protein, partial [Eubacterium sp.]
AATSLSVKWDAVSKASKYYIKITNNTKGTSFSKTVTTNYAKLNNLTLGNQYSVKVCAYVSGKWGAYSNKITAKTAKPKPSATSSSSLKAPSGLKTTVVYTATAKLAWNKVSGASGYYVYKYSGGKYKKAYTIKGKSTTNCTVTGLSPGTKYYYCVAAYNSSKTGSRSSSLSFVTKPNGTKITSSSSPSKTKIKINWQKPSRAYNGYQIVYSRKSNFSKLVATKNISSKNTTTYTGKNFTKGVTYYIRVRSYRTVDSKKYYSVWSNTVKVKSK